MASVLFDNLKIDTSDYDCWLLDVSKKHEVVSPGTERFFFSIWLDYDFEMAAKLLLGTDVN